MASTLYKASKTPMLIILSGVILLSLFGLLFTKATIYLIISSFIILFILLSLIRKNYLELDNVGFREKMGGRFLFDYKWEEVKDFKILEVGELSTIAFAVIAKGEKQESITNIYKVELDQMMKEIKKYKKQNKLDSKEQ
ncbi:hypothetical protein LNTAR_04236 [Lentisphaera araneosa HTCC2155]|uniref:Uncharacterized protein n=1 Tax=Lentisphaera araneosa HTCC2155 TaxID=313628 RepID=A6DTZ3_9BACT|nr:hypothetical protein [Lentisphaera araneosa]EDM24909.1 hypothetical protein LNTAR_04236 [Lentisphaera araneosa HTCC2155]